MIRWIVRILIFLFVIGLLLAIFAPSILSTQFGKHTFFRFLKNLSGYQIQIQELQLQWTQGQSANSVDVIDSKGRLVFHADHLKTSAPLWKILFYHDVGSLQVQAPFVLISAPEELASRERFQKMMTLGLCQSPGVETINKEDSINPIQPPLLMPQPQELSHQSEGHHLLKTLPKIGIQQAGFIPFFSLSFTPSFHVLGDITVTQGSAQFTAPGLQLISAKEIQLSATLLPKQIKLQASGLTQEGSDTESQGNFQLQLLAYPGSNQMDASLQINHFPLRAADQVITLLYPDMKGVLYDTLGDNLNADVKLKNLQETLQIFVDAASDRFSAHLETKLEQDTLKLVSPAIMRFQIPPQSLQRLSSLTLKKGFSGQVKLDELSIPLQNHALMTVHGTLKSEALEFEDWTLDPFSLYVGTAENSPGDWIVKIDSPQAQFNGSIHLPETWQNLSLSGEALLPQNTKLTLSAPSLQAISLTAQGDLWKGQFKGSIDPIKKTVALTEASSLTYQLPQLPTPLPPLLKTPLPLQITLEPCLINLQTQTGLIKGKASTPPFNLGLSHVGGMALQFTGDLKTKQAQFSLATEVDQGPLTLDGTLFWPFKLSFKGSCKNFPVASIQPFLKEGPALLPLIGPTLTTNFQAQLSGTTLSGQVQTTSSNLSLQAALKKTAADLQLIEPASFTWNLTPESYQAVTTWLHQPSAFTLAEPALFKGSIDTLIVPLQEGLSLGDTLSRLQYQGKIATPQLSFTQTDQTTHLSGLQIQMSHPASSKLHQFQISAVATPQGSLSCKGGWTPAGTADIHLLLDQFPSAAFDFFTSPFVKQPFSFNTLCGPSLNLTLDTTLSDWSGPVAFKLYSDNLRSSLQGALNQGVLTLSDTFHLQLDLTSSLSQALFPPTSLLSSTRSLGPITLEISPQGFSYPAVSSNLSQFQVGSGKLELGKLLCKNEGNIQITLGILKLGQYRSGDDLKLWFAPLDFQIQNGLVRCERTELLIADQFQVCLWGDVNLPGHSVDGILGLTAICLRKTLGVKNLPDDYVLQIPVRGTLTDVNINKGKAATQIGALLLWQQKGAIQKSDKGPGGAFLGEMLNKLGPLPGGDQKAPPAKKPFPWDTDQPKTKKKQPETSHHRKHFEPDDSPLDQLLKLLR